MANYIIDNRLKGFRIRIEPHQYIPVRIREIGKGKLKGSFEEQRLGYCSTIGSALQLLVSEILAEKDKDVNLDEVKTLMLELRSLEKDFYAVRVCPFRDEQPAKWSGK